MNARAVGRLLVIALVSGLIALVGEASGVAYAWAVLAGVAVSVHGAPPVAPRGATALLAGVVVLLVVWLAEGAGAPAAVSSALATVLVVAGAGAARLRDDPRSPAIAVLVGGGTVLAGIHVAAGTGITEVAPALGGLVAGLLPMLVAEVVTELRTTRGSAEGAGDIDSSTHAGLAAGRDATHAGPAAARDGDAVPDMSGCETTGPQTPGSEGAAPQDSDQPTANTPVAHDASGGPPARGRGEDDT